MSVPTRTMTVEEMRLIADIFRLILREIKTQEDKENLAPGEVGISYREKCFYVRDPYTGELFSPNSLSHLQRILTKFDETTGLLNADRVSGVRFYSSISQLAQLGIDMTADTIIRQMEYPSILMADVEYPNNYTIMGFPGKAGIIIVYKISPESVFAIFYDYQTYVMYNGKYNPFTHYLEGWIGTGSSADSEYVESEGGGNTTTVTVQKEIKDLSVITVRVTEELNPGAKIRVNDLSYLNILQQDGTPTSSPIAANNIIMLIYDEARNGWILVSSTESTVTTIVNMVDARLTSTTKELEFFKKDTAAKLIELRSYIDIELKKPGMITTVVSTFTPSVDSDTVGSVEGYVVGIDKLMVNYNQTILRENLDYIIEEAGSIQFTFQIPANDVVQFIVIKQVAR